MKRNMPELPDVVVYIEALERRIVGHRLTRILIRGPFLLRSTTPPVESIQGKTVREVRRIGKQIAIGFEGERQYVQLTATTLVGVSATDGKLLWRYDKASTTHRIYCSTPLYQDGMVFAASSYDGGGGVVKLSKDTSGGIKAEEVWFTKKMQNHHGGVILLDGCLYGANGGSGGGDLICLDFKTGNVLWDGHSLAGRPTPQGSLTLADGRLY